MKNVLDGLLTSVRDLTRRVGRLEIQGSHRIEISPLGGFMIAVTAGETLYEGEVVQITQGAGGADGKVYKNAIDSDMPIGAVYANASADATVYVVVAGIAYVKPNAADTATRGYVIYSSTTTAGRVSQASTVPAATTHNREIGHWLYDGTGAGVITLAVLHFN